MKLVQDGIDSMQKKENSQVAVAYECIRDQIISYTLLPGTQISDNQFSKELGMSRAPIREAILMLQMDGLVEIDADRKTCVSPLYLEDIADILSVRFALESEALRLIARGGWLNDTQEAELRAIHEQLASSASHMEMSDHYEYDDMFHQKLAEYSGNSRICNVLGCMRLQMQRARWLNVANTDRQHAATAEHEALLAAICAKDLPLAVERLEMHFSNSLDSFRAILSDRKLQTLSLAISNFRAAKK